jgi:hypothetical protein
MEILYFLIIEKIESTQYFSQKSKIIIAIQDYYIKY